MTTRSLGHRALLEVRHLHKAFGGNQAVNDVSFSLQAGELLALIGPNGAGKSTTFNVVNGQLAPDSGEIMLDGVSLLGCKPHQLWRMGVSRTFQMAQTFGSLTVVENVQMALLSADGLSLAPWRRATHYRPDDALQLLAHVQLDSQATRACNALAYGDVKRLELAMALANSPRLLLMDEPTAGMAPDERHALMALTHHIRINNHTSTHSAIQISHRIRISTSTWINATCTNLATGEDIGTVDQISLGVLYTVHVR